MPKHASLHRAARAAAAAATTLIAFGAASGIVQAAPFEPNDSLTQATGPMVGGTPYNGAIETENDADYFYFNVNGQRQIDVSFTNLGGCSGYLGQAIRLDDPDGNQIDSAEIGSGTDHVLYTTPHAGQYVLTITDQPVGCQYSLRVDPPDAITTADPGTVVTVDPAEEADDVQRVLLNGNPVGSVQGQSSQSFSLGVLPPSARITFEAANGTGEWSWNTSITTQTGRQLTTVLDEKQSGGSSDAPRVGVVRRVTVTPSGGVLDSCGEALAPTTCFPVDADHDGSPLGVDCNDADANVQPGAREVVDNDIDENCDGVVARHMRFDSGLSLSRRGTRYSGRVVTGGPCVAGRRVTLRRVGSGTRSFGSAVTRSGGTFTFRRAKRLHGRLYAVVAGRRSGLTVCRSASSRPVRG